MNCKEGDLAVVVKSYAHNEGRIVKCVRTVVFKFKGNEYLNAWFTEPELRNASGFVVPTPDNQLRPIRNQPGADETLSWKDVPQEVAA